jgi:two-component system nitrate/nitrite response regulator NarL
MQPEPSILPSERARAAPEVLIVEDHEMLAQTLALALSPRFRCAVADLDGVEGVIGEAARLRPALVLLDLGLGEADGLDLIPRLLATGASVLVLTGSADESRLGAALALGASGWVSKSQAFERLLEAVEAVVRRLPLLGEAERRRLVDLGTARLETEREMRRRMAELTPREREVLWALSEGETASEIAAALSLSVGTVRSHIQGILGKLGVSNQLAAVAAARLLMGARDAPYRVREGR